MAEYGSFYRMVPLPEGASVDEITASFQNGVLEVSVPLPARAKVESRTVPIEEAAKAAARASKAA